MKAITKREYYRRGGVANPRLFRKMWGGTWRYYDGGK